MSDICSLRINFVCNIRSLLYHYITYRSLLWVVLRNERILQTKLMRNIRSLRINFVCNIRSLRNTTHSNERYVPITGYRRQNYAKTKYINSLGHHSCLDDDVYQSLRPTAASTPTLYGLPKLHKNGIPLRPILASTGSFTYKSAKRLSDKLASRASLRDHPTNLKDSFEFIDQIRKIDNLHTKALVSFDVKSLFTNIPVDFTIKLVLNQLFPDEQGKIHGLSKKQFDKLLKWTCKKNNPAI